MNLAAEKYFKDYYVFYDREIIVLNTIIPKNWEFRSYIINDKKIVVKRVLFNRKNMYIYTHLLLNKNLKIKIPETVKLVGDELNSPYCRVYTVVKGEYSYDGTIEF